MKRAAPEHPKTLALMQALDVPRFSAVGLLELLWHFTARYAPQGDIGRWTDANIAAGVSWPGDAAQLVGAFRDSGYIDEHPKHRLLVHDWHDHADDATKKALARAGKEFLTVSVRRPANGGRRRTMSPPEGNHVTPAGAVAGALPEPVPDAGPADNRRTEAYEPHPLLPTPGARLKAEQRMLKLLRDIGAKLDEDGQQTASRVLAFEGRRDGKRIVGFNPANMKPEYLLRCLDALDVEWARVSGEAVPDAKDGPTIEERARRDAERDQRAAAVAS